MFKKKRQTIKEIFKKIGDSAGVGKRALAITLALSILVGTLPAVGLTASADTVTEFKVIPYDISARIEIPEISNATSYKVYYSTKNSADLTALKSDSAKRAVVNSGSYLPYAYAVNGAKDTTGSTIAISAATTYYFYLVTNDGTADTLQSSFAATTKATASCYWTSPGNYDTTWYSGSASAFTISTAKELAGLAYLTNNGNTFTGKTITLSNDIDLSANVWTPIGTWDILSTSLQKPFAGTFDGGNKTVSGLHTNNENKYQGLFGYTSSGMIKNVGIINGYIKGTGTVGSVVGQNNGTISDCYNTATVRGTENVANIVTLNGVGGIAGNAYNAITNCSNTGSVSCPQEVGGIVGRALYNRTIISGCSNAGTVSGQSYVGGIAGYASSPSLDGTYSPIKNCSNTGTISATGSSIGGIAGVSGTISNCSNTGAVSSSGLAGGIVGDGYNSITDCSNTGPITGNGYLGGIAGQIRNNATISNCSNTASVSGGTPLVSGPAVNYCGGIAGVAHSPIKSCYNTGEIKNTGGFIGGIAGGNSDTAPVSNCYNIGTVSSTGEQVGGVVGRAAGSVTTCYNTAAVSGGEKYVGGIAGCAQWGYSIHSEISYCYNVGSVSGTGSYIGGIVGIDYFTNPKNDKPFLYNYYCGYSGGVWQPEAASAQDVAGQVIPFISYRTPLGIGEATTITELTPSTLNSAFKTAFGITAIQYPDAYESSDPGIITVNGYTVTAIANGTAFVKGKAGTGATPNANIILTQKSLNMTDTTSGFNGPEITVKGMISQPITVSENCMKAITAFSIGSSTGVIDSVNHTISVTVPYGTNVKNLIATFSQNGSGVKVGTTAQTSGTTGNDFRNPVIYTVTAKDGSTQNYKVTVTVAQNTAKAITLFYVGSYACVINEANHTISVTVPKETDVTNLIATFSLSGSSVKVGSTVQTSRVTANDFTNPVIYTVTADDGSTQNYTVTVAKNAPKEITGFSIGSYAGVVNEFDHTISVTVPKGTDVTNLIATFSQSGSSVEVGSTVQTSGTTANDFTNPVIYTVTAADGNTQDYIVTVMVGGSANKLLESITKPDDVSNIPNGTAKTSAALNLPSTVTLITDKGPVTAKVTWAVGASSYDTSKTTTQTFVVNGTVTLPAGVNANGIPLSTRISVTVDAASGGGDSTNKTVTGFAPLATAIKSQTVENGADFSSLNLPQKLEVIGKDISGLFVKVSNWICGTYNSTVAGAYKFTPALDHSYVDSGYVDSGYVIGSGVSLPEITVTVKGKPGSAHNNHAKDTSSSPSATNGKTGIQVDKTNNTATVTTKPDSVITNGTTTHMETNVPSVLVDNTATATAGEAVDTTKKSAVVINLPTDDIKQQLAAKQAVELTVTVPSDVARNTNENLAVTINSSKEILEAAKENLSDVTIRIKDVDTQQLKYSWTFKGADLAKSTTPMTDVNIAMCVRLTTEVPKVHALTPTNTGLVLSFDHSGVLPSVASVKFSALEKGFQAGQTLYFYYYNPTTRQIDPLGSRHTVDADGNIAVQILHCSDYVLLPNAVRSLTLDTKIYTMPVNHRYEIGVKLTNTKGTSVKVYSSTKGAASIIKLKNGNYQVTGLKVGLTYIMFDVYDEKNKLIKKAHASVRLITKNGVKPTGDSWRQTAIF